MFGVLGYVVSVAAGYITARATERAIEPQTVAVVEIGGRQARIVHYWSTWPPRRWSQMRRYKSQELRAGMWLDTGIEGESLDAVTERTRAMLSGGPK